MKRTAEVRAAFLKFFEERGHRVVPSDSLIPSTDPTLLFTSAGMVQFKPNFQNPSASPYPRATSCQRCLRTSDIERVGHTLRHLTFFEMLGNFSFGDYFKKESIEWGWTFITKTIGLPGDRFVVSVYKDDDEAFTIWEQWIDKSRIYRLGEDTNFWTMGPTGPCGPCSEILWDRGPEWSCGKPDCGPACDCDRYLEVWNHVFTQFDRQADGKLVPLPRKNIDTGMGLERLTLLAQGVTNPFETDAFQMVFRELAKKTGGPLPAAARPGQSPSPRDVAFRRIADHARAVTFMITDGILPSNEGRGYVLRRLLRQAVRAGKTLGIEEPFLYRLTGAVIDLVKDAYPETLQRRETIASVVKTEEEKFLETLDTGTRKLEDVVQAAKTAKTKTLSGKDVFQLYDTYGFPLELTREIAEGLGMAVDEEGFKKAQEKAAEVARSAWKGSGSQNVEFYHAWKAGAKPNSRFRGYDALETKTTVGETLYRFSGKPDPEAVKQLAAGEEGLIILAETPFYPEGGGQVGDVGVLEFSGGKAEVLDTQSPVPGFIVHRVKVAQGTLTGGAAVSARVDAFKRESTMRHHTATHMLHKALREVLGPHVTQAGSLVAPDRLRFDFNHNAPLTSEERRRTEDIVNRQILRDLHVRACPMSKEKAHTIGAMMLFGEKYGEEVRAVSVSEYNDCEQLANAWSLELCGGTHVHTTGQIGFFKIIGQSSVSAGVRRIEAVAGYAALDQVRKMEHQLSTVAETLKTSPDDLQGRVEKLLERERQLERESEQAKSAQLRSKFDDLAKTAQKAGHVSFVSQRLDGIDGKQLRDVADRLKDSGAIGVVLLAGVREGRASFVVAVRKELSKNVPAGQVAKEFAGLIQGSGGGRPDFAEGGTKQVELLDRALAQVGALIEKKFSPL